MDRDSLCDNVRYCIHYAHMHCCRCQAVLMAEGDGPVYPGGRDTIAGYVDDFGKSAEPCSECKDDFYLLCSVCRAEDSRCGGCRLAQVVL